LTTGQQRERTPIKGRLRREKKNSRLFITTRQKKRKAEDPSTVKEGKLRPLEGKVCQGPLRLVGGKEEKDTLHDNFLLEKREVMFFKQKEREKGYHGRKGMLKERLLARREKGGRSRAKGEKENS